MARRTGILFLLAPAALLAAGCGVRTSKPFTAKGSVSCFRSSGFTDVTTAGPRVGLIAAFADNGGLKARSKSGKVVTVAFTADAGRVADTEKAFRRAAPPFYRRHMRDIMQTSRNAVLVWSQSPNSDELGAAMSCLKP